jgi:alanine racemase
LSSTLTVNLKQIGANLKSIKSITGPKVQIMAVVKDEAYGHGLLKVADYLKDKADWFCVADIDEALLLRDQNIQNPILVFGVPELGRETLYVKHNITATISDLSIFDRLEPGTNCHLQFDTGMQRLGFNPDDIDRVLRKVDEYPELNYSGIFTHFANADDPGHPRVIEQLNTFKKLRIQFPADWMAHTSNTGAVFHYHQDEVLMDGVRTGIGLYGLPSGDKNIPGIKPIAQWNTKIVQIRKVKKGDKAGYGSTWEAPEDGNLAILPVGYADGIFRSLSNQFQVEIQGRKYPQAGTVSMDYIAVYLGKDLFEVGESITILGQGEISAKTWAEKIGTIPYEILTSIAPKVKRVYLD